MVHNNFHMIWGRISKIYIISLCSGSLSLSLSCITVLLPLSHCPHKSPALLHLFEPVMGNSQPLCSRILLDSDWAAPVKVTLHPATLQSEMAQDASGYFQFSPFFYLWLGLYYRTEQRDTGAGDTSIFSPGHSLHFLNIFSSECKMRQCPVWGRSCCIWQVQTVCRLCVILGLYNIVSRGFAKVLCTLI